jgi:hypothetical protein
VRTDNKNINNMSQNIGTPWIYKETLVWQLTQHIKNPEEYDNIFPMKEWTLQEYRQIFHLISKGWLIQSSENIGFIINPEWEGEPLWECEEEEECDDCEGKCRSNETEKCDDCGIELRIGCANNPSDHSIFNDLCDDCRGEE